MAKVVVTGGAGFIGSHIVDKFIERGDEVHVLDDLSTGSLDNVSLSGRFHQIDVREPSCVSLLRSIEPEIIIHTAAQVSVRISMEDPKADADTNVIGLLNLLQTYQGVERAPYFIFISTGGAIYGDHEEIPTPETALPHPDSVYGCSKYACEIYLDMWRRTYGLNCSILRLGNVYGPRQNPHGEAGVVAIFAERLLAGEHAIINGDGEQSRDFIYVSDVVRAVKSLCDARASGVFNIGTGVETSINEIFKLVSKSSGADLPPTYAPAKTGEQMRSCLKVAKAEREIGWKASKPLSEGIDDTVNFFRSMRKLQ